MAYRIAFFITFSFAILYLINVLLMRFGNTWWWYKPPVRIAVKWTPVLFASCGLLWIAGSLLDILWFTRVGGGLVTAIQIYLVALLVAALLTTPLALADRLYSRLGNSQPPSSSRRRFLHAGIAAVPALTVSMASAGIISANAAPRMPRIKLSYPDLPEALHGLKLLHLSDIHIGPYIALRDLEALVERARQLQPDMAFISGDICDHLPSYLDALRILEDLQPVHGTYASLGNHEYFRGIEAVRSAFGKSQIPLLVDEGLIVDIGLDAPVHVGGADDPRFMRGPDSAATLRRSVEATQESAPRGAFRILMSHRSVAFDTAAPLGVDLTLSGHTHGFQLGTGGRSLFESSYPDRYIWGQYRKGDRQLYTSSGVGHWMPFRLGCSPEAPLIVLERS